MSVSSRVGFEWGPVSRQDLLESTLPLTWGRSFADEDRALLFARCRLVLALGLLVSLALITVSQVLVTRPEQVDGVLRRFETVLDLAHFASFALGLAALYLLRLDERGIQWTAFAVIVFNALLLAFSNGLYPNDIPGELVIAMILFVPAAIIPWPSAFQVGLAIVALTWPALGALVHQALPPSLQTAPAWSWTDFAVTTLGVAVLGAISVLVSRTLYSLRRKTREVKRLGNYLVERRLGAGAMGEVFVARHARLVRPSAVKVLRVDGELDAGSLRRFEREVQLASSLSHPNTITIFDYGRSEGGDLFYAMEYLDGLDLQRFVDRFGPMPPERAVHVLRQVCGSLSEAHSAGIVHRDLKPANVFLTHRGGIYDFVKVLDFGIARQIATDEEKDPRITRTGAIVGTPEYIAPESAASSGKVDGRADLYGLGAVAFFLLTGEPPFTGPSPFHVIRRHFSETPRAPSVAAPGPVPRELDEIVLRCLAKVPEGRFGTAAELDAVLAAIDFPDPWSAIRAHEWWLGHRGELGSGEIIPDRTCDAPAPSADLPDPPKARNSEPPSARRPRPRS
jgi:serine/threonine-protein kinase